MGAYAYKAIDPALGRPIEGEIEAENKLGVTEHLRGKGLVVLQIDEQKNTDVGDLFGRFKKVKSKSLVVFTRQLSTMIDSGMSLLRAMYILEEQTDDELLQERIASVREDIEAGSSLGDALDRHPDTFNELYVAMVRAGEAGGILEDTLRRVATQLEKDESLRRQVKSAMMYPTVIMVFAFVVLVALLTFLVPVFSGIFKDLGSELPLITRVTVKMSNAIRDYWYILIFAPPALVFGFKKWKATASGHRLWHKFLLRIPFKIGDIIHKVALARWSRSFASLTAAGVPILQCIDTAGRTAGNNEILLAMDGVQHSVETGGTVAAPLKASPVFPSMVGHMISSGEETGALDQMLSKVADFYEEEVDAAVKALTSILEPVMIILVGGVVGFIVIAMYMPMFKLYDKVQ
ncbi:MAG: type II secretion system F family protein [Solirubrobacterales bacterium]|nr:type II secretion system F family protein [Solirubrobacterales bacterium]